MPLNWRRWIPRFGKKKTVESGPPKARIKQDSAEAHRIANFDPQRVQREETSREQAMLQKRRTNMALGAKQSETFQRMCKERSTTPETVLKAIEEKLENPQGIHWRRLSAWWNVARVQIYSGELPKENERLRMKTDEEKAAKEKQESEDMQREGLWIAKAITHYSEKTVEKKIGEAVLAMKSIQAAQQELNVEAAPIFHAVWAALNHAGPGSPKARVEYLKAIEDIWSDPKTSGEQKIATEANWLAGETVKAMKAQAARNTR